MRLVFSSLLLLVVAAPAQARPSRATCALPPQLTYDLMSDDEGPSYVMRRFRERFHGAPQITRFDIEASHCSNGACVFRFENAQGKSIELLLSSEGLPLEVLDETVSEDFLACVK